MLSNYLIIMSEICNRKTHRISSWPGLIAQRIPRWVSHRLLLLAESVCLALCIPLIYFFFLCLQLFGSPNTCGQPRNPARERQWKRDWKRYRAEEEYWKPTPLGIPRKRRLSLPIGPFVRSRWWDLRRTKPQTVFNQQRSPLGRLPAELRLLIYAHLVEGKRFHIQDSFKRFGSVECISTDPNACDHVLECLAPQMDTTPRIRDQRPPSTGTRLALSSYDHLSKKPKCVGANDASTPRHEILALAKTCRLLYCGYLDTLYTASTFSFTSLSQFQIFSTTIPLHRLMSITSLDFHCELHSSHQDRLDVGWEEIATSRWKKAWEIVAKMEALRFIHVDLRVNSLNRRPEHSAGGVHKWMEHRIFDPMRDVRQAKVFDVVVNWYQSEGFVLGYAPFTLERRDDRLSWRDDPFV
jgi:hypothetical protein